MTPGFPKARLYLLLTALLGAVLANGAARAEMVAVPASADASIYEANSGNLANGAGPRLFAGRSGFGLRRALLEFDVSTVVPSGATIDSVQLRLTVDNDSIAPPATDFGLHRILTAWNEGPASAGVRGGTGAPSGAGDVTWIHASQGETDWNSPGGDFVAEASTVAKITSTGAVTFSSTPDLIADVQAWLAAPETNLGWMLLGGESQPTSARRFHSRESTSAASRPALMIEYSLAELLAGDINGDDVVDLLDFNILKENFGAAGVARDQGDLNGDETVDLLDFNILKENFGASAAVPEPSAAVLAIFATAVAVLVVSRVQLLSGCKQSMHH